MAPQRGVWPPAQELQGPLCLGVILPYGEVTEEDLWQSQGQMASRENQRRAGTRGARLSGAQGQDAWPARGLDAFLKLSVSTQPYHPMGLSPQSRVRAGSPCDNRQTSQRVREP
jgi:hypothetical protein